MKEEVFKYNPERDIQAVEQFGFVDLASANATSSVPGSLDTSDLSFNGIDDPNSIGGRASDVFEAGMMSKAIEGYVPPKKNAE